MKWQSKVVVPFSDLSPEQVNYICNGCGGNESWFKPTHAKLFRSVCQPHDYDYAIGGGWLSKFAADRRLRGRIRLLVKTTDIAVLRDNLVMDDTVIPDFLVRQIYYRWADAYFIGVSFGGNTFFRYGSKRWPVMN